MDKTIDNNSLPKPEVEELDLDEIELANLDDELAQSKSSLYQRAVGAISGVASLYIALRSGAKACHSSVMLKRITNGFMVLVAGYIAVVFSDGAVNTFLEDWAVVIMAGAFALLVFDVAENSGKDKSVWAKLAGVSLAGTVIGQLLFVDGLINAALCVMAGAAIVLAGKRYKSRALLLLGIVTILLSVTNQVYVTIAMVNFDSWISLAVIGAVAIVVGSLTERYGAIVKLKWERWGARQ